MKFSNHIFPIFTLILILTSCEIENGPVKIISLTPSDTIVSNNKSILLVCIAEDGDNDKLRYSWNSSSGTIVSGNKDSAIWTAPSEYGYQTITVKVSDDLGSSDALGTSIKVIPNRAPVALDSTDTISANMEYSGIFNAYDPDDDSLTFSIISLPTNGIVNIIDEKSGTYIYNPEIGFSGIDSFTFNASDGELASNEAIVTLIVSEPVNNPPVAIDSTFEIITGTQLNSIFPGNDPDNDPLTFSITNQPNYGFANVIDQSTGSFQYIPDSEYVGIDNFTFTISDGELISNEATITIIISDIPGTIQGTVTNAINGSLVSDVIVNINNSETITDANGYYIIYTNLEPGEYMVNGSSNSFCPYNGSFQILDDFSLDSITFNFSLSPIPEAGETRMVLNWGELPSDLDSHLKTPPIEGQNYHIYYGNRGSSDSAPYATLDYDVVTGYGPETMTIKQSFSGNYIYYINQFSSSGTLSESNASVQIYNSPDCSGETIYIPNQGEGRYWYVCNIDGETGEITIINQIQESEPTQ